MSILRVYKKAQDEQGIKTLTSASKRIKDPFGFRVHHIENEDFYSDEETTLRTLCDIFKTSAEEQTGAVIPDANMFRPFLQGDISLMERAGRNEFKGAFMKESQIGLRSSKGEINIFTRFIVGLEKDLDLNGFLGEYIKDELNTPLNIALMNYFTTWHENAHLTGCTEPQADMIGALMCRQAIEDTTFLSIKADARMIETLFVSDGVMEKYGWKTAQALDFAITLPQDIIDSLTEDDMFEIALMDFDNHKGSMATVLLAFYDAYENIHVDPEGAMSIKKAGPICDEILKSGRFDPETNEAAFLERLCLALKRSGNPELYYTPSVLQESPRQTFTSKIPDCIAL